MKLTFAEKLHILHQIRIAMLSERCNLSDKWAICTPRGSRTHTIRHWLYLLRPSNITRPKIKGGHLHITVKQ